MNPVRTTSNVRTYAAAWFVLLSISNATAAPSGVAVVSRDTYCLERPTTQTCSPNQVGFQASPKVAEPIVAVQDGDDGDLLWVGEANYDDVLAEKRRAYRERVESIFGPEMDSASQRLDKISAMSEKEDDGRPGMLIRPFTCGSPPTDQVPDGQGGCKLIFGNDSRAIVDNARNAYPFTKFVTMTVDKHSDSTVQAGTCSATFLDEDYVITAAHCVYDTVDDHWIYANPGNNDTRPASVTTPLGRDTGRGYVCLSGWMEDDIEFEDNCEFVQARWTMSGFINASSSATTEAVKEDVAILELRRDNHLNGLGQGAWVAMSAIDSASTLETKLAVSHGYPAVHPPGLSFNMDGRDWDVTGWYDNTFQTVDWEIWGARQYKTYGIVDSPTTKKILRTKLESSGGQSGSGIIYYSDDDHVYTGQNHYLIGVLSSAEVDFDSNTSDDHVIGPTVKQFRDWANTILP